MLSEFFSEYTTDTAWNIFLLRNPDISVSKVTLVLFLRGAGFLSSLTNLHSFLGLIVMHVRGDVVVVLKLYS